MIRICDALDRAIRWFAELTAYLIVAIAGVQLAVAALRYFYSHGSILLQELTLNLNVVLVSCSICYGVLRAVHTRVDVLTHRYSTRLANRIELAGVCGLMLPAAAVLVWSLLPYALQSWSTLEGSRNVGGMPGIYIVKSAILLMAVALALQSAALILRLAIDARWPYPHASQNQNG